MTEKQSKISAYISVARPGHWVKNSFVLVPLMFSRQFRDGSMCVKELLAFAAFCLISSAIYVLNDLCDRAEDRNHPKKQNRPIAAGLISPAQATAFSILLIFLSLLPAFLVSYHVLGLVVIYGILNLSYSLKLKHVAILDVMSIAGGFVLRILAGSAAISVSPSVWLVLCTIMVSLFLGFAKRRAELVELESNNGQTRIVLKDYSEKFLDQIIAMVAAATMICYTLYTVDAHTIELFGNRAMLLTAPSVIYGICRYLYLVYHKQKGGDPVMAVLRDIPSLINLAIWITIAMLVICYGSKMKHFLLG